MENKMMTAAEERALSDARLEVLGTQARALTSAIAANCLELGRIFAEAKTLVKHGQFGKWLEANAPVGERAAENWIRAYRRFADKPDFAQLPSGKLIKLLGLPDGQEDDFVREHDVSQMTGREIDEAVKKAVAEARKSFEQEKAAAVFDAVKDQQKADEVGFAALTAERDQLRAAAEDLQANLSRITEEHRGDPNVIAQLNTANAAQKRIMDQLNEKLREANQKVADLQDQIGRGNSQSTGKLTGDRFRAAALEFVAVLSLIPQMRYDFRKMDEDEIQIFRQSNDTVMDACARAGQAISAGISEVIL